jgi:hypothetical protein
MTRANLLSLPSFSFSGLVAVLWLAVLDPATANAFCRLTTEMPLPGDSCSNDGMGLAWRRPCISFSMTERRLDEPPLEDMRDVADASFLTWSNSTCGGRPVGLEIRETAELGECEDPEYNKRGPNANTVIFVSDWAKRELPPDAFGLTLVWHNPESGQIYDADMQINETLGALTICRGSCAAGKVDLQNVLTHEAGHFLGLGHSPESGATMASRATVGEVKKRDLTEDDRGGLCSIYDEPLTDRCTQADFDPDRGFSPICKPPAVVASPSSNSGCSVATPGGQARRVGQGVAPFAVFALAGVWVLLGRRTRHRRPRND